MTCRFRRIRAAFGVGLAIFVASGCSGPDAASPASQPSAAPAVDAPSKTGPSTRAEPKQQPATGAPACTTPPTALLEWAGVSIASHPGPIKAASLVYAASTGTGDWYVLAVDRQYVLDDGTLTGDHSRDLALTNALDASGEPRKMIPLSEGSNVKGWKVTWRNVNWSGDTLAAGQRAAQRAIECLDANQS